MTDKTGISVNWGQFPYKFCILMCGNDKHTDGLHIVTDGTQYVHVDKYGQRYGELFRFSTDGPTHDVLSFKIIGLRNHEDKTILTDDSDTLADGGYPNPPANYNSDVCDLVNALNGVWPDGTTFNCDPKNIKNVLYIVDDDGKPEITKINGVTREEFDCRAEFINLINIERDHFTQIFIDRYTAAGLSDEQIGMLFDWGFELPTN